MSENEQDKLLAVQEHRITKLEDSDSRQWGKISDHSDWIKEWHVTLKLLKIGFSVIGFLLLILAVWVRGGLDAVLALIAK